MIVMALLGASEGALLFAVLWRLVPRRTSLRVQLARFDARPATAQAPAHAPASALARLQAGLGDVLVRALAARGIAYTSLRQDLTLSGRTFEAMMARKALGAVAGFVVVITVAVAARVGAGLTLPASAPVLLAAGTGAGLFFAPDVQARRVAAGHRRDFRRALGSWLDLVALEMAGSAAPAEALPAAARVGSGWPMAVLRDTLYRATVSGQDHWEALTDLGARIGVPELVDLATLTRLVGRDGARVRETLTARAATLRRALLADTEGQAGRRDQSMLIAQILIGFGFVVFLMYPAIVNVLVL